MLWAERHMEGACQPLLLIVLARSPAWNGRNIHSTQQLWSDVWKVAKNNLNPKNNTFSQCDIRILCEDICAQSTAQKIFFSQWVIRTVKTHPARKGLYWVLLCSSLRCNTSQTLEVSAPICLSRLTPPRDVCFLFPTALSLINTTTLKTTTRTPSSALSPKITACGTATLCRSCSRKEACSATWICTPTSPTTPRASTGTSTTPTAPMVWPTPLRGPSTLTTSSTHGLPSFR